MSFEHIGWRPWARDKCICIYLDGFRHDYIDRYSNPDGFLRSLCDTGVRAAWSESIFPTNTYPNHWTIGKVELYGRGAIGPTQNCVWLSNGQLCRVPRYRQQQRVRHDDRKSISYGCWRWDRAGLVSDCRADMDHKRKFKQAETQRCVRLVSSEILFEVSFLDFNFSMIWGQARPRPSITSNRRCFVNRDRKTGFSTGSTRLSIFLSKVSKEIQQI